MHTFSIHGGATTYKCAQIYDICDLFKSIYQIKRIKTSTNLNILELFVFDL